MSALTTNQITTSARRKLLEETSDLVSDATILEYANQTYDDLKFRTRTNDQIKTATITFTNGVGTLPADFGTLYGDGYRSTTDKTPFSEKSISDFDSELYDNAVTIEDGEIKVTPSSETSLIIKYFPSYTALSSAQNPEINSYFHELIIYGILYRAYEDLQDEELSNYYEEKYEDKFEKKKRGLSSYEEGNQRGNQLFGYQKLM